jgi:WD40 repeat protein
LWQTAKAERLPGGDLPAHQKSLSDLILTPDQKHLITAGEDGEVKIWSLASWNQPNRQPLRTFQAHAERINAFAASPDGRRFVTASGEEVKLWETATGKELRSWQLRVPVRNLAFAADGKTVATANANTTLYLLELP